MPASEDTRDTPARRSGDRAPVIDMSVVSAALVRALAPAAALGIVIGLIVGLIVAQKTPVYEATAKLTATSAVQGGGDSTQLQSAANTYIEALGDDGVQAAISARIGHPVSTGGGGADIAAQPSEVPGMVELVAKGSSPDEAKATLDAAVAELSAKDEGIRDSTVVPFETAANTLIASLEKKAAAAGGTSADDTRDQVSELRRQVAGLRQDSGSMAVVAENASTEKSAPLPAKQGAVAGLVGFALALVALTAWFCTRRNRADTIWARRVSSRTGAVLDAGAARGRSAESAKGRRPTPGDRSAEKTETAESAEMPGVDRLPASSDAVVASSLDAGQDVVVLERSGEEFTSLPDKESGGALHSGRWTTRWWNDSPPSHVGLGLVVVPFGDRGVADAELALDHFAELGVPARLVLVRS